MKLVTRRETRNTERDVIAILGNLTQDHLQKPTSRWNWKMGTRFIELYERPRCNVMRFDFSFSSRLRSENYVCARLESFPLEDLFEKRV